MLGIEKDDEITVDKMVDRLLAYRIFSDGDGKINLSVTDVNGSLLVVSQFTLAADTKKGLREFSAAAKPDIAKKLYQLLVAKIRQKSITVATGRLVVI